ncbi:MAG: glycosyltransferase [Anaerolineales bacterium]|nr:glycosyltransferase [Anaerolineales bacterium]
MGKLAGQDSTVGHFVWIYLFQTGNWIYDQIRFQTSYPSIILARKLENLEQFPYDDVYALSTLPLWRSIVERIIRKLNTGYYPYHYQIAMKEGVRLLHAHLGRVGQLSIPLASAIDVPLITSFYGADMSEQPSGRGSLEEEYATLFDEGDLFLVEGPAAKRQIASIGCPQEKIRIQRLGIDLEKIRFQPRQADNGAPIRFLMAATFAEKKGMPFGVEAFCRAVQDNPNMRLTVVGDARPTFPREVEIKRQILDLVSQYKAEALVDFLGYVPLDRLRALAYEHDIFMHPSVTADTGDCEGGSPVVITEMAAAGLPIISTHHCDIPEVVLNGTTGFLSDERDVDQLREAIIELASDRQLRIQMAKQGREHVEKLFNARSQGWKLAEIYRELLE